MTTSRTNADRSCVLAAMKQYGVPLTRDEFLSFFYMGNVPEVIDPEDEAGFPEQFQREALDALPASEKVQ